MCRGQLRILDYYPKGDVKEAEEECRSFLANGGETVTLGGLLSFCTVLRVVFSRSPMRNTMIFCQKCKASVLAVPHTNAP